MSRYINDIETKKSAAESNQIIQDYMKREGFKLVTFNQEEVWKKGMGILTGPQFMKTTVQAGKVRLEAWIKFALLPGVYIGEMGITGFFGFALKLALKKKVESLQKLITG